MRELLGGQEDRGENRLRYRLRFSQCGKRTSYFFVNGQRTPVTAPEQIKTLIREAMGATRAANESTPRGMRGLSALLTRPD